MRTTNPELMFVERIRAAGHAVAARTIVKDEVKAIRDQVKAGLPTPLDPRHHHHGRHWIHRL